MFNEKLKMPSKKKSGIMCAVKSCRKYACQERHLKYLGFPSDIRMQAIWLRQIDREDLFKREPDKLRINYRVCSEHFENRMWANDIRTRLLPKAIPTLNLVNAPYNSSVKFNELPDVFEEHPCKATSTAESTVKVEVKTGNAKSEETTPTISKPIVVVPRIVWVDNATHMYETSTQTPNYDDPSPRGKGAKLRKDLSDASLLDFKCLCDRFLPDELAKFVKQQADKHSSKTKRL